MAAEPAPSRIAPLQPYTRDVFSPNGEDGILERVFELLGVRDGWCVEFGAWDGHHLSNTANLIESRGWSAVLIEADPVKAEALRRNMAGKATGARTFGRTSATSRRLNEARTTSEPSKGANVLLIDDTWTAGAHAQSAAYALQKAGARTVSLARRHRSPHNARVGDCRANPPRML